MAKVKGRPKKNKVKTEQNKNVSVFASKKIEESIVDKEIDKQNIDIIDNANNEDFCFDEDIDIDFSLTKDEDIFVPDLSEILGSTSLEETEHEILLKKEKDESDKQERIIQAKGTVKYYPIVSPQERKEEVENVRNRIIDFLMSRRNLSYIEAKATLETILLTTSLEKIEESLIKEEQNERDKKNQKSDGVQITQFKTQINYY